METKNKITPIEEKTIRNIGIISDYKLLIKSGKKRPETRVMLMAKYNVQKSLVYQISKQVENSKK
jgi:hypothetical protein